MKSDASYRLSDVMHENGRFFVLHDRTRKSGCYLVLRNDATCSVLRGTFHFSGDPQYALSRAIEDCDKRASGQHWAGTKA